MRSSLVVLAVALSACHAQAQLKVSADKDVHEESTFSADGPATTPSPVTATPTPEMPAAPMTPPAEACPMTCYVANGADAVPVTDAESSAIRSALEPVVAGMRACTNPDQWRRRGSPILNLRVAADGLVNEVDVDPHHSYDYERTCIENASRQSVTLSLPGRHDVRCAERCVTRRPAQVAGATRRRR